MYYSYDYRDAANASLIADLENAMNGEYGAITCYEQFAKLAPNEEQRKQILEIRGDEIRHFRTFSQIYYTLTGKTFQPQQPQPCPKDYPSALRFAFHDEQKTVDFYHRAAETAEEPYIKESFKKAAADEQNHAVWFLYFLTQG